jgi:D-alanine-D-alanine ligase
MKNKIKVAVLMGGRSPEHEISLLSGQQVTNNLDSEKYEILPVVISKDGKRWQLTDKTTISALADPIALRGTKKEIVLSNKQELAGAESMSQKEIDVVFIAMHGPFGEDGTVQGLLDLAGVKYTGSGVLASALGMDKMMFRKVLKSEKLPIPKHIIVKRGENFRNIFKTLGPPPYFVKPNDQGSSVGASIVKTKKDLGKALKESFKYGKVALVDEYIKGRELTCAVIGNDKPKALPVIEIRPLKGEFFDYESKYTESGAEEIVPAEIPKSLSNKIQDLSLRVYKAVGCRGFGRVDFIIKDGREPVILEINTIPGLTPMSLLPKAAKAAGMGYSVLLSRIIRYAAEK